MLTHRTLRTGPSAAITWSMACAKQAGIGTVVLAEGDDRDVADGGAV